ncbi:dihydrolipoyl dehydrogenase [Croceicoccus gelatinilyticus]|uniref:dihydrolipoyl dehydrogenase n=1 Tax=Croceicoccus gelatinilyticus TaxID=2835536 RepID=UPI001BCD566C|nr:dihydrolipoyl dehydrogenase [Croceicoccus gelatinilyticus]MBS7668350.1 dihydrolipoyl dehydrogenase [Croceicoccus gelatinilyticus]
MAEFDFDVIVIGAGPGGYVAAIRAAQLGLKTACVESRETLGGTCLNVGCIPSKAMLHGSELFEEAKDGTLAKFGVKIPAPELDLSALQGEKATAVKELTGGIEYLFKKNKVTWLKGLGSFVDKHTVKVGDGEHSARNIVIATGSSVTPLPGVTVDNEGGVIVDSTGALALDRVPEKMVVIGGGVIGLELGSVWRRLGAEVTVVEFLDQLLPGMDDAVRKEAGKIFKKQGMELKLSTKVTGAEVKDGKATLTVEPSNGGDAETLEADCVLVAIGRKPNTDGLNLDAIGLATNQRGQIETDHDFRTKVDSVWAVGDVIPGPMLAHKAEDEGIAVSENIAGEHGIVNHAVIPSVVYTMPEIAGVGMTEQQAKDAGHEVKVGNFPMMANSRAKTNREPEGFVKVIADAETDRVLGAWCIASLAGTMIAQIAQAMEFGATSEDIAYTCHAHPTHSEAVKEAAMAVRGKPIHI